MGPPNITESTVGVVIDRQDTLGTFTITIPYTLTGSFKVGKHQMDVEVTYFNGTKETLFILELTMVGDKTL